MIVWQGDPASVAPLRDLARSAKELPARIQALYALEALEALDEATLIDVITKAPAAVVRHAVILAEPLLDRSEGLLNHVVSLASTRDSPLRLQLACSLGASQTARVGTVLTQLAMLPGSGSEVHAAVLSSLTASNIESALQAAVRSDRLAARPEFSRDLFDQAVAMGNDKVQIQTQHSRNRSIDFCAHRATWTNCQRDFSLPFASRFSQRGRSPPMPMPRCPCDLLRLGCCATA
jgi:hypothetical protein